MILIIELIIIHFVIHGALIAMDSIIRTAMLAKQVIGIGKQTLGKVAVYVTHIVQEQATIQVNPLTWANIVLMAELNVQIARDIAVGVKTIPAKILVIHAHLAIICLMTEATNAQIHLVLILQTQDSACGKHKDAILHVQCIISQSLNLLLEVILLGQMR